MMLKNVERILAIEYLAACQGIDFLRPLKTTQPLEAIHSLLRLVDVFIIRSRVIFSSELMFFSLTLL
jgi:histidine ammonia-lyase